MLFLIKSYDVDLPILPGSLIKKASTLSIPLPSLKFPPVTAISYSSSRSKDWDDILTAHTDETFARSWTMQGKKLGNHHFGFAEKGRRPLGSAKVGSHPRDDRRWEPHIVHK